MERLIFHVDVNSAFLSWEAVRRVRLGEEDPRLIPSAIGGDRETRKGVILAKSIPAKKYGVKTGEPIAMALRKCPQLRIFKSNFSLYTKQSAAFVAICKKYAPVVEQFSIDECFLDMTGTEKLYGSPVEIANKIRNEIRDSLGFTVNIGIGSNKLLAKMASDFEKPDKVHTLYNHEIPTKMWNLPVRELFSVGASTATHLERAYVRTIGDLAHMEQERLISMFGNKMGTHLHRYANGIDESPVVAEPEDAKGYSVSTTLARDVADLEEASRVLMALTDSVTSRMRADGVKACCIAVTIRSNSFKDRSHQRKLQEPTDITDDIFQTVMLLFEALWDGKTPLRLLGVSLSEVSHEGEAQQLSFFSESEEKVKARRVDKTVDEIRKRFGYDTIKRASVCNSGEDVGKKYKAQMENEK